MRTTRPFAALFASIVLSTALLGAPGAQAHRYYAKTTKLATGLFLTEISDPSGPYRIRILTIDPGSGVTVDMAGAGALPSLKTTSQMAIGEKALAAVNGDFGAFEGRPLHAFAVDGNLDQTGFQNGASFAVSYDKKNTYVEPAHLTVGGKPLPTGSHFSVPDWNQGQPSNGSIVAFTPYGGSQQRPQAGDCEVLLKKSTKLRWMKNQQGLQRKLKVVAKRCGGNALRFTKKSKLILAAGTSGAGANTIKSLVVGKFVRMSWRLVATPTTGVTEKPPAGVMEMMGGMPLLISNGTVLAKSC